jgi:Domain of unknown function (DUF6265)
MYWRLIILGAFLSITLRATDLQDLGFITGHWRGEAAGKQIEETWSAPEQGSMTGMYREMQNGKTTFYEFITIEDGPAGPVLLIGHFEPGLHGWEDKNKPAAFHLKTFLPEGEAVFESNDPANPLLLAYSRTGKNTMDVVLERKRNGDWVKQTYKYTRAKQ